LISMSSKKRTGFFSSPSGARLEFIFPYLWQNHNSENVRIQAAFIPMVEEHSNRYLRFYQKFLSLPIIEYRRKRATLQNEKTE